jgi:glycosyltransferase involved in cell wall biosynthesis
VVALDTGALAEMVQDDAGRITPYGGDAWKLDPPDLDGLAHAAAEVLQDQGRFRAAARRRAEAAFGIDAMVDGYLKALGIT